MFWIAPYGGIDAILAVAGARDRSRPYVRSRCETAQMSVMQSRTPWKTTKVSPGVGRGARESRKNAMALANALAVPAGSGAIPSAVAAPLPASGTFACAASPVPRNCGHRSARRRTSEQCDRCGLRDAAGRHCPAWPATTTRRSCAAARPLHKLPRPGRLGRGPGNDRASGERSRHRRGAGRGRPYGVDGGMVGRVSLWSAAVEMMVDSGAQHSVISAPLARRLGLMNRLDRSEQGVAAGVGRAGIIGKRERGDLPEERRVSFPRRIRMSRHRRLAGSLWTSPCSRSGDPLRLRRPAPPLPRSSIWSRTS